MTDGEFQLGVFVRTQNMKLIYAIDNLALQFTPQARRFWSFVIDWASITRPGKGIQMIEIAFAMASLATAACPRPDLPLEISEDVWANLENSEFYKTLPSAKTVIVRSQQEELDTGSKPGGKRTRFSIDYESRPLSACIRKASMTLAADRVREKRVEKFKRSTLDKYGTQGDLIILGVLNDGRVQSRLTDLTLDGTLFPLSTGREVHIHMKFEDKKRSWTIDKRCSPAGRETAFSASKLDDKLTGQSIVIDCTVTTTSNGKESAKKAKMIWLEDAGIFAAELLPGHQAAASVVPKPGQIDNAQTGDVTWTEYRWKIE